MNKTEAILFGVVAAMVIAGLSFWGYQDHQCKIEAIKAGVKAEEIRKACM